MWRSNIRVEISSEKYKWVYQMKRNKWREKMHKFQTLMEVTECALFYLCETSSPI